MEHLSVRPLEARDIPLIVGYWRGLTAEDLKRMYVDPNQILSSSDFNAKLAHLLETPVGERSADPLIWDWKGNAIGFTNLNGIEPAVKGDIHLHLAERNLRGRGLGRRLFMLSVEKYFLRHAFPKIICEPAATNAGPNGLLAALGIPLQRTYRTTPSPICFEHEVNRYEIDRPLAQRILTELRR